MTLFVWQRDGLRPSAFGNGGEAERATKTLGQLRHVACASGCMSMRTCLSMRTSLEEGIKLHGFTVMLPEQFLTETGGHREAVVAADQRMVIRCFGDSPASSTMFLMCRLPPTRRYRPGIGSSEAAEQWHAGRAAQAVSMLDQQIVGTLRTMPCVSAFHSAASIVCPGPHDVAKMEIRTQTTRATLKMTVTIPATSMIEVRLRCNAMCHPWWQSGGCVDLRQARRWLRSSVRQATQRRPARQGTQVPARSGPAFSPSPCGDGP